MDTKQHPVVLYKNQDFLVVEKPAGMLMHGIRGKEAIEETVASWLVEHYSQAKIVGDDKENRPGIVHRLDKDTSGVVVVALNQDTFIFFKKLFQAHEVKKEYRALVWGRVKEDRGVITLPIGLHNGSTKRTTHIRLGGPSDRQTRMVKEAITEYRVAARFVVPDTNPNEHFRGESLTLLSVFPKTGRTHQIRVHFASLNHPVLHDPLYGGKKRFEESKKLGSVRQFLHARAIEFVSQNGERIRVESPLPSDLEEVLAQLKREQVVHP